MKTYRLLIWPIHFILIVTLIGCGGGKKQHIEGIKENISLEYHADLDLRPSEGKGFILHITEMFDIAKRPSEGNRIIGVKIGDKNIDHKVIGAGEYEYFEEADGVRIILGEMEEFLPREAGRFRLRLTRSIPVTGKPSGIFRRRLTFEPAPLWALVEDEISPDGITQIKLDEPDLGYILLHTPSALGNKQPAGGRRAPDRRSVTYAIPADITKLNPLAFTYFPSRASFYFGSVVTWIVNRVAWMLLGIVIYMWWRHRREKQAWKKEEMKMVRTKDENPVPPPLPPTGK